MVCVHFLFSHRLHPVKRDGACGWLLEINTGGAADVDRVPIDNGFVGGLIDVHSRARLADYGSTAHVDCAITA